MAAVIFNNPKTHVQLFSAPGLGCSVNLENAKKEFGKNERETQLPISKSGCLISADLSPGSAGLNVSGPGFLPMAAKINSSIKMFKYLNSCLINRTTVLKNGQNT